MNTIKMIVVNVNEVDRKEVENIEGKEFKSILDIANVLKTDNFQVYNLSDFIDAWNNEELTEHEHWVGYINIK